MITDAGADARRSVGRRDRGVRGRLDAVMLSADERLESRRAISACRAVATMNRIAEAVESGEDLPLDHRRAQPRGARGDRRGSRSPKRPAMSSKRSTTGK